MQIIRLILLTVLCPFIGLCQTELSVINSDHGPKTIYQVLSEYIQLKSESGEELQAGLFLRNLCQANNLNVYPMGEDNGNFNFAASLFPLETKKPNIILLNHIDTVSEGPNEQWDEPPYSGKITDEDIWGRGAYDNKGAAIMQLFSLLDIKEHFELSKSPYNVTFLAVSCEETQCPGGVNFVIDEYLELLNPALVLGEGPPSIKNIVSADPDLELFGISVAQKRPYWLALELNVKTSGHGSVPPYHYANKDMLLALNKVLNKKPKIIYDDLNIALLKQLGQYEKGLKKFVMKHPRLFKFLLKSEIKKSPELLALFTNTVTLTRIHNTNKTINNIPASVKAYLDCRLLVGQDNQEFLTTFKKQLNNEAIQITILNESPVYTPSDSNNFFYKTLEESIIENFPKAKVIAMFTPNFNDTTPFRIKGITTLSSIPISMPREYLACIHNANERIPKHCLVEGAKTYTTFLKKCLTP